MCGKQHLEIRGAACVEIDPAPVDDQPYGRIARPPGMERAEKSILDPNQMRAVRALIRGFEGKKTIFLSTHILPEVEATCGRVTAPRHKRCRSFPCAPMP